MPIVLFRVDERLIHGQVVVGWGERLNMDRIVVIDDELCHSAWEQELYCLGVPPAIDAAFVDVEEARRALPRWRADPRRIVILLRNLATLERLAADHRLENEVVNLGGIHHTAGRERVLPYLFLDDEERATLERIAEQGVRLSARDLPGTREVPLSELLRES